MNNISTMDGAAMTLDMEAQPIKVLHIITGDLFAGAERVQELLADRLTAFGYEVSFVCLKVGVFQQELEAGPREAITVAMRSRFDLIRTVLTIAQRARDTHCQLIHSHTPRGALIASLTAAITGLPMAHHMHSPAIQNTINPWVDRANALVERFSLWRAAALIPVSASLARRLSSQGYAARRIFPVPNGVATSDLRTNCALHDELRVGMVALFRPRKGIETLLWAMSRMIRQDQVVRLRAIGSFEDPEYEQKILAFAEQLGLSDYIEWRGFQTDVLQELTNVDALVLPSLYGEGMPMVVLEAMAVGLPIIASDVDGVPEVVREGKEGMLVEPGHVGELVDAMSRLHSDRGMARTMGHAGRCRQRDMYSDCAMAEHVSNIYDRLLGRTRLPLTNAPR